MCARMRYGWFSGSPSRVRVEVRVDRDDMGNVWRVKVSEEAMRNMGANADREAVQRYRQILSCANELGLTVLLTLYHWPILLWLHDPIACRDDVESTSTRVWLDQLTIVEFAKYAAFAAEAFGELVDLYTTINEPRIISEHGYLSERGEFPPCLNDPELFFTSMKHLSTVYGIAYE